MKNIPTQFGAGSRVRILRFLLSNVGRVVTSDEIRKASRNTPEWRRRLRELRDEFGYQIQSHRDRRELSWGQYMLATERRLPVMPPAMPEQIAVLVLERDDYTCQMCGMGACDRDPFHPWIAVRMTVGHIIQSYRGDTDLPSNLRSVCTNCNDGLKNVELPKPDRIELLTQVRRATLDDQLYLFEWLRAKFAKVRRPEQVKE